MFKKIGLRVIGLVGIRNVGNENESFIHRATNLWKL